MTPETVGSGVIQGGWEYIYAAYALSWVMLIGYTASLWFRAPRGGEE
ncbi:MAG: hypothetical protein H6733_14740 [Alphaproteobacteria bacterium]|nr:hypothetical protein [Alphaproteobacteria bacterium]